MQCIKCGEELAPGDKICYSCGAKVPKQKRVNEPGVSDVDKGIGILAVVGGIASSLLLCLGGVKMLDAGDALEGSFAGAYYEGLGWSLFGLACFTGPLLLYLALRK